MPPEFYVKVAEHGTAGLICAILLFVIKSIYNELKVERDGRLKDAQEYAEKLLTLSDRVHSTVDKMAEQQDQLITAVAGGRK